MQTPYLNFVLSLQFQPLLFLKYIPNTNTTLFSLACRKKHEVSLEIIEKGDRTSCLREIQNYRLQDWGQKAGSGKLCWVVICH